MTTVNCEDFDLKKEIEPRSPDYIASIDRLPVNYNKLHWTERREVRERYIEIQKGKCYHCGKSLSNEPARHIKNKKVNKKLFPKNFFDWPIHLHHNHETGMTIGAVHCYCNAVLWQYYSK